MSIRSRSRLSLFARYGLVARYGAIEFIALALFAATVMPAASALAGRYHRGLAVTVQMKTRQGKPVGTVKIVQLTQGALLLVHLRNLPPGEHAFHIRAKASCEPQRFVRANVHYKGHYKGHYIAAGKKRDPGDKSSSYAGVLANVRVTDQGTTETEIYVPQWVLGVASKANRIAASQAGWQRGPFSLLDDNGSAIIIHANADDYDARMAGSAGPGIACGVIRRNRLGTIGG